jgi:hypothetical protein
MPCTDVTEVLVLSLDNSDRVQTYSLHKETCGGAVAGRGLIRDWVKHREVAEVLALQPAELLMQTNRRGTVNEYLTLKHLFSIQGALAAYRGEMADHEPGLLQIESIEYAPDETRLQARIKLDVLTEKIKACGLCGDACNNPE